MRDYKVNTFQMNNSIFQFGLTPIQFVVYSYLKYCAGNRCACSIKLQTIASVCECSRSSVKRALNVLRDRGFIDIKGGVQKLRGRVSERRTLPLLGLGRVCSRRTQRAFGAAMRLCASLLRGVAARWAA